MAGKPMQLAHPKVDYNRVTRCMLRQFTKAELAAVLDMTIGALDYALKHDLRFRDAFERGIALGRARLKDKQLRLALDGDREMLKWLGQNYLNQASTARTKLSGDSEGGPIRVSSLADLASAITPAEVDESKDGNQ